MSKKDDSNFFRAVLNDPTLRAVLESCNVDEWAPPIGEQPHNSVLKLWKPDWLLPLPYRGTLDVEGVNVHFEARVRNELRVEAEIHPYIPSLDKQPATESALRSQLDLKADLLGDLRKKLLASDSLQDLGVTDMAQPDTSKTSTQCAVKFNQDLPESPESDAAAAYFARIIETATPLIDATISHYKSILARYMPKPANLSSVKSF